jgi:hypothetical protein
MRTKLHIWAGCLCAAIAASNGHAAVIYSNLGPGDSYLPMNAFPGGAGFGVVVAPGPGAVDARWASSFTTGPHQWSFQSVDLVLGDAFGEENSFEMSVLTDAGGVPGQVLQTIPLSGVPFDPAIVTVPASDPLILDANTTYWIALAAVVQNPDHISGCTWLLNNTLTGTSADNGGIPGAPWIEGPQPSPALRVNGTIVPDPTSAATTGWIALLCLSRRRLRI